MNSVSEKIDERILRLLGLEDVFDLDYDTYMTLLKEAIVTGTNKLPQEELAILANERKRIRGKKGRFKPKKDKITADKVATTKFLKPSKKTLALPESTSKPDGGSLSIGKPLESIAKTLATLLSLRKKTNEEERRDKESQRRTKREEGLEGFKKGISAVSSAAKKMLAPFQSIIDRIWKFIFFTLLGRAFTQLMDWLGNPANKKKIEVLGRFLKDWWPTLLGAAVLFLTPFGKFVRSTLKLVGFFAGKLVKQIPLIARAVKGLGAFAIANPLVTIGVTGAAATFGAEMRRQGEEKKQVESEAKRRGVKPETVKIELEQAKRSPFAMFGEAMQNIGGFAGGGSISSLGNGYGGIDGSTGQKVSGFGPDTQMIVAQPGEVVMNKKAVDAVGADNLLALNRQYGGPGANKPKMGRLYNTGGVVGSGILPGTGTVMAPKTMGNTTVAGYQNKFLGIPLGRVNYPKDVSGYATGYSQQQMQRYERYNPNKQFTNLGGAFPALVNRRKDNIVGDAFRNFGTNVRTIKGAAKRREDVMREMGYAPSGYTNLLGQPIRRQGGGMVPQGPFTPLPSAGYVRPQGSFIPKPILRLPGPMPGTTLPFGYNPFSGLRGGGLVKENTGMNVPGATADRQLAALQPGEYVLPVDTVNRLGTSLIDKLVAMTDSNSNPYLGRGTVRRPQITPLRRGQNGMMTLPPITQSASGGAGGGGSAAGSKVPAFSASSPSGGAERSMNAGIYGIVG